MLQQRSGKDPGMPYKGQAALCSQPRVSRGPWNVPLASGRCGRGSSCPRLLLGGTESSSCSRHAPAVTNPRTARCAHPALQAHGAFGVTGNQNSTDILSTAPLEPGDSLPGAGEQQQEAGGGKKSCTNPARWGSCPPPGVPGPPDLGTGRCSVIGVSSSP